MPKPIQTESELSFSNSERIECLKQQANEGHELFEGSFRRSIKDFARSSGDALRELKKLIPHGEWTPWLKANFKASEVTARLYMRVAEFWPEIESKFEDGRASLETIRQFIADSKAVADDENPTEPLTSNCDGSQSAQAEDGGTSSDAMVYMKLHLDRKSHDELRDIYLPHMRKAFAEFGIDNDHDAMFTVAKLFCEATPDV